MSDLPPSGDKVRGMSEASIFALCCSSRSFRLDELACICREIGLIPIPVRTMDELLSLDGTYPLAILDMDMDGSPVFPENHAHRCISGRHLKPIIERGLFLDTVDEPFGYIRALSFNCSNFCRYWFDNDRRLTPRGKSAISTAIRNTLTLPAYRVVNFYDTVRFDQVHSIVESSHVALTVLDPKGRIWFANLAAHALFRRSSQLLKDHSFEELLADEASKREFWNTFNYVQNAFGAQVEVNLADQWGQRCDALILMNRIFGHDLPPNFVGLAILDITERKHAQRALVDSENRYRTLFEGSSEGILIADAESRTILYANPAACRMFGYSSEEMKRLCVESIHPDENRASVIDEFRAVPPEASKLISGFACRRKDGSIFPSEIRATRMSIEGRECNVGFFMDITERKKAEEERRRMEEQLRQTQKLESLGILAGGVAHDFNNLLMAIIGNAEMALCDLSDVSPARPAILDIQAASRRAADLCKQMLAYSGKGRFVVSSINLSELVEEMGHMLQVSISKKTALRYNLKRDLSPVLADATQMRQIIMNLIINASEALRNQTGIITISTGVMHCDREYLSGTYLGEELPVGAYLYLEVSDNGCGIDEETRDRIFDPFFTTKFTGRGLGLAAVMGIVRGHGGAIKVYSEPGKGTTFKVLLPMAQSPAEIGNGQAAEPEPWVGSGAVLLVDDEESVRIVGKRMLGRLGFQVLTAENGLLGVDVFMQHQAEIRCVILDLTMPQMDGEETFREIRRHSAEVPVIISSGYNQQEVTERFVGRGLAGFIQKPYMLDALRDELRKALDK